MTWGLFLGAVAQGFAFAFLAWAAFLSLRTIRFADIGVDGTFTTGAAVTAVLLTKGAGPWPALAAAMASGMIGGSITGLIHTRLGVNDLLSGILTMTAAYSINLHIMGRPNVGLVDSATIYDVPGLARLGEDGAQLAVLALLALGMLLLLRSFLRTDYGMAVRATGENEGTVPALGIDPRKTKLTTLALSNGLAALGGGLLAQYNGLADISMGVGALVSGIAGLVIGERLFGMRGVGARLLGALTGAILYRLIIAFALTQGLNPNDLKLLTAVFVLAAISLPNLRRQTL